MSFSENRKRPRSSTPPWKRPAKDVRRDRHQRSPQPNSREGSNSHPQRRANNEENFAKELTRRNQIQEAEQMREWVAKEDEFVLKQSKKKAKIRVKEGRARIIDLLAVTLNAMDDPQDLLEDDGDDGDVEAIDPSSVFDGLDATKLAELEKDISTYLALETSRDNRRYWNALRLICKNRSELARSAPVQADIDRLLKPKTLAELTRLEEQILSKLQSNEPIDVEYWEQLKASVEVYKAEAELKAIYKSVIDKCLSNFRREQCTEASNLKQELSLLLQDPGYEGRLRECHDTTKTENVSVTHSSDWSAVFLDPEPELKVRQEDKYLGVIEEAAFLDQHNSEKQRITKLGYVPFRDTASLKRTTAAPSKSSTAVANANARPAATLGEDFSSATNALYDREVARGIQEDEEIFAGEEEVQTKAQPQWAGKYRPRKPRYFNRVQMGYEWNKYNQTHYDHDNPPPKVVQGYKFNIFYPDLIDKTKAPTYRIEREGGRKRGESFAPAGEEDTCLIRFFSGPPYEDIGFRIVDKEWDFSAKRERGFRSSFDKGILQLHFQFKKVYYRK
ncbi:uncharacterized protein KY384_001407 [Bacidia gigantensis]|uniref:uncharacterized protein n=1 Tax=Bacidia gigantensis TaxID=2732470 RepID=UPI001D053371|nr:uncharacterized protein KY384_001407 [Bacidia gigantensis]KAG8533666.1 hypothetical protein KY384_001407 [Bacidia gigantensis]